MNLFRNSLLLGEFDIASKSGGSFRFKVGPMCDSNEVNGKTSCNFIKRKHYVAILRKIIIDSLMLLPQELRIKSEVLDRKIVEVEELKSELLGGGNSRNKHLLQAEASNGYKTFPEKRGERGGNSSTTTKNVKSTLQPAAIKPTVKQAINRKCTSSSSQSSSSSNRHSVQICQV